MRIRTFQSSLLMRTTFTQNICEALVHTLVRKFYGYIRIYLHARWREPSAFVQQPAKRSNMRAPIINDTHRLDRRLLPHADRRRRPQFALQRSPPIKLIIKATIGLTRGKTKCHKHSRARANLFSRLARPLLVNFCARRQCGKFFILHLPLLVDRFELQTQD